MAQRSVSRSAWAFGGIAACVVAGALTLSGLAFREARESRAEVEALRARLEALGSEQAASASRGTADDEEKPAAEAGVLEPDFFEQLAEALESETRGAAAPRAPQEPPAARPAGGFGRAALLFSGSAEERLAAARNLGERGPRPLQLLAARTLLELEPEEGIRAMQALIDEAGTDRRSQRIAAAAIESLAEADSPDVDRQLYALSEGENALYRRAAVRGLERRGDPEPMTRLVAELSAGLESPDGGVRGRTAQQLGRTGSATAVPALMGLVNDANSEVRLRAAEALGRTRAEVAVPELTAMLDDPVAQVREAASRSLEQIRNPPREDRFALGARALGARGFER